MGWRVVFAVVTTAVCLLSQGPLHAAPPIAVEFTAEPQQVDLGGGKTARFEARVLVCPNNQADGFVNLTPHDGSPPALLVPVAGILHFPPGASRPAATLVLLPAALARPAQPADFVVAAVGEDAEEPACDLWDLTGSSVHGGTTAGRAEFPAEGAVDLVNQRCGEHDFGQLVGQAEVDAPRQTVFPLVGGELEFEAMFDIDRDNSAVGFVDIPLSAGGSFYELFFGALLPNPGEPVGVLFVVGTRAGPQDVPSTNDTLRAAAVALPAIPDCELWDLINGSSGEVLNTATFDAETFVKIKPASLNDPDTGTRF